MTDARRGPLLASTLAALILVGSIGGLLGGCRDSQGASQAAPGEASRPTEIPRSPASACN